MPQTAKPQTRSTIHSSKLRTLWGMLLASWSGNLELVTVVMIMMMRGGRGLRDMGIGGGRAPGVLEEETGAVGIPVAIMAEPEQQPHHHHLMDTNTILQSPTLPSAAPTYPSEHHPTPPPPTAIALAALETRANMLDGCTAANQARHPHLARRQRKERRRSRNQSQKGT